jgi:hypothetical protein
MKPAVSAVAANMAANLRDDIAPQLSGFRAGNTGMMAAMMDMIAEEWDRAAARLVGENADLRRVLARGAEFLAGPAGQPDMADQDLRISALERENELLRAQLIELQAAVERDQSADAQAIDEMIWDVLRRSVESRRITAANF